MRTSCLCPGWCVLAMLCSVGSGHPHLPAAPASHLRLTERRRQPRQSMDKIAALVPGDGICWASLTVDTSGAKIDIRIVKRLCHPLY